MKLHVTIDGEPSLLELDQRNGDWVYRLKGAMHAEGMASVSEINPGIFSVLLGYRSYRVYLTPGESGALAISTAGQSCAVTVTDARDRSSRAKERVMTGPMELRAQMPGRIVKLLVKQGSKVQAGESLIVIEAMKMQNEMKSPKDGVVGNIYIAEGATVSAGARLMAVE